MLHTTIQKCLNYLQVSIFGRVDISHECFISVSHYYVMWQSVPVRYRTMEMRFLALLVLQWELYVLFSSTVIYSIYNNYCKLYWLTRVILSKTNVIFKEYYRYLYSPVNYYLLNNDGWKFCQGCQYII